MFGAYFQGFIGLILMITSFVLFIEQFMIGYLLGTISGFIGLKLFLLSRKSLLGSSIAKGTINFSRTNDKDERRTVVGNTKNEEKNRSQIWKIAALVIIAAYWISQGTPNPILYFTTSSIKQKCVEFAEKNKDDLFLVDNDNEIRAGSSWIKNGRRVVQLVSSDPDSGQDRMRLCVYGKGTIQIPSIITTAIWN